MNTNDIIEKCAEIALSEPRFRAHDNCDPHQLIADKIRALKSSLPAETVSEAMVERAMQIMARAYNSFNGGVDFDQCVCREAARSILALASADSDNTRLQARVAELEAAVETATPLIGARNDVAHPAIKAANINEAWHILNRVRLPAPPVGDR